MLFALAVVRSRGTRTRESTGTSSAVFETVVVVAVVLVWVGLAIASTRILLAPRLLGSGLCGRRLTLGRSVRGRRSLL